ncbi:sensor histidine kinase [Chitinophaga lutea]
MKKLLLLSLLAVSAVARSQSDWSDFSISVEQTKGQPTLGIAIPYNGIYDNFSKNVVGISHWNPGYKLGIDSALDDRIPLFFVYDTAGVYFLAPYLEEKNAGDYELTVLLNNKIILSPWSNISRFTSVSVGGVETVSGITDNYRARPGQYLVVHLRDKPRKIMASMVIYFSENRPEIKSVSTAADARAFTKLAKDNNPFNLGLPDMGWHRQYTSLQPGPAGKLQLAHYENNVLIDLGANIYKREAVEYALIKDGQEVRKWSGNEYDNHYILLRDLPAGDYRVLIRFRRQRSSVSEIHFSLTPAWYQAAAFRAAVAAFILLTGAALFVGWKYGRQRRAMKRLHQQAEQTSEELKSIHALLNPHFTFNALSSIQGLINKGETEAASRYISSFGELLRETLRESKAAHIPLTKELDNLDIYLGLERLRYPFSYQVIVDAGVDQSDLSIPPFLLQPFVENAIKHGLSRMNGQGQLILHISRQENHVLIRIADNGPGFSAGALKEGYGLRLSKERIALLNREYGEELITLQVSGTTEGATVLLVFKNWI